MLIFSAKSENVSRFSELFLAAGGSAFLLSVAHVHPASWFLSLFSLVPYLWKLKRSSLPESIILGVVLAFCFSIIAFADAMRTSPHEFVLELIVLISIFTVFSVALDRLKRYIGFYPVFIAALWMPLKYFLIRFAGMGTLLDLQVDHGPLFRLGSLFGLLFVSFLIMLVNSMILIFIEHIARIRFITEKSECGGNRAIWPSDEDIYRGKKQPYLPNMRAPPIPGVIVEWLTETRCTFEKSPQRRFKCAKFL